LLLTSFFFNFSPKIKKCCKDYAFYDSSDIFKHFAIVKNSTNNDHFILIDDLAFIEFNKIYSFSGVKLLKNQMLPVTIPFAMVKCYFLRVSMERKLKQMEVAGLIDFYMREYSNKKYLELTKEDKGPQKLRLDQLAIGFEAFLLFLGVAAFVFLLEILAFCLKKIAVLVAVYKTLMFQY